MRIIGKTPAVLLGLIAVAVLVHFVFSPFYASVLEGEPVWAALNWFMVFGIIVAFITVIASGRATGTAATNGRPLFYAVTVLGILFFWDWFNELAEATKARCTVFLGGREYYLRGHHGQS